MNLNILNFVKEHLSGYVIGKMSDFLGENPYKTASALENVLPVVLGGLVSKANQPQGPGQMMDQIKDQGHDGKVFDNLSEIVKEPDAMLDWLSSGAKLSNNLFGDKLGAVIDSVSSENDIRKTSSSSLLSFLSPLVLGAIGKHVTTNSLGISGITDLLASNQSILSQTLTPNMKFSLGLDEKVIAHENKTIIENKKIVADKKPTQAVSSSKWLTPLLLAGLLLLLGVVSYSLYNKYRGGMSASSFLGKWGKKDSTSTISTEGDTLKAKLEQRRKEAELSEKAKQLGKVEEGSKANTKKGESLLTDRSKKSNSSKSTTSSGSKGNSSFDAMPPVRSTSSGGSRRSGGRRGGNDVIEEIDGSSSSNYSDNGGHSSGSLASAMASNQINSEFALDGITFVNGGYEFTGGSKAELSRLAAMLKRNPRARVFIQGFAMDGDTEDGELSQMRAEWVRYGLIDRGIKPSRIEARGHCEASQTTLTSIPRNRVSMKLIR